MEDLRKLQVRGSQLYLLKKYISAVLPTIVSLSEYTVATASLHCPMSMQELLSRRVKARDRKTDRRKGGDMVEPYLYKRAIVQKQGVEEFLPRIPSSPTWRWGGHRAREKLQHCGEKVNAWKKWNKRS